jgi:hypothetical protein
MGGHRTRRGRKIPHVHALQVLTDGPVAGHTFGTLIPGEVVELVEGA